MSGQGTQQEEGGIMACWMTVRLLRMITQMERLQGGTIVSSTHGATPTVIEFSTDHNQSMRKSAGSSTKENRFIARRPTIP
jgi:hypothetical protein